MSRETDLEELAEPMVLEASIEDHIIADCPRCLDPMLLGENWRELIVQDGHDVPVCPDCEPDQWTDGAGPKIDAIELLVLGGEPIDLGEGS